MRPARTDEHARAEKPPEKHPIFVAWMAAAADCAASLLLGPPSSRLAAYVTCVVTTSAVPSHPSAALMDATLASVRKRVRGAENLRAIIACDICGLAEDGGDHYKRGRVSAERRDKYHAYVKDIQRKCSDGREPNYAAASVLDARDAFPGRDAPLGFARVLEHVISMHVRTPLVLVVQHDYVFTRQVDLCPACTAILSPRWPTVHAVGLQAMATVDYPQKCRSRYGIDIERYALPLPSPLEEARLALGLECNATSQLNAPRSSTPRLLPTLLWYDKTHVARKSYYLNFVLRLCEGEFPEDTFGQAELADIKANGMEAHLKYGNYVLDQGREPTIYHLSGRKAVAMDNGGGLEDGISLVHDDGTDAGGGNARAHTAVVAGLGRAANGGADAAGQKRFKQQCFKCGEKGHSFKNCPN